MLKIICNLSSGLDVDILRITWAGLLTKGGRLLCNFDVQII